jgi:hypothetical protein
MHAFACNGGQGRQGSNLRPSVLETASAPIRHWSWRLVPLPIPLPEGQRWAGAHESPSGRRPDCSRRGCRRAHRLDLRAATARPGSRWLACAIPRRAAQRAACQWSRSCGVPRPQGADHHHGPLVRDRQPRPAWPPLRGRAQPDAVADRHLAVRFGREAPCGATHALGLARGSRAAPGVRTADEPAPARPLDTACQCCDRRDRDAPTRQDSQTRSACGMDILGRSRARIYTSSISYPCSASEN